MSLLAIDSFSSDDAKDLSALCSHISVALENIKRADESEEVRKPLVWEFLKKGDSGDGSCVTC